MGFAIQPKSRGDDRKVYINPSEKASLLSELGQRSGQAIEALGLLLDTPGAIARGFLAGDPLSGFSFDRQRRVTGEELLDSYGLKPDNPYFSTPAGFAVELATDPLAYATFALGAGGKAAAAARKAGIIKHAPYVASKKIGAETTLTGAFTSKALEQAGLKRTESVLRTRPLVGSRLGQATSTLDELVRAAPDPTDALTRVRQALGDTSYASVKDDRVGGLFGFSNPFTGQGWAYNPNMYAGATDDLSRLNWAEKLADRLDRVGQGIAWSYPVRVASSAFDKAVGGKVGVADQITAMRRSANEAEARQLGRSEATLHAMNLDKLQIPDSVATRTGVSNFYTPEGSDAILRLVEGKPIGNDLDLLRGVPGLDNWIVGWKEIAQNKLDTAKSMGLRASELRDDFGSFFSPRSGPELDLSDMALNSPVHTSLYAAFIRNQTRRNRALSLPGGTFDIRELSVDRTLRAWMKGETQQSEGEIAQYIVNRVGNPLVDERRARGIARAFREIGKDVPDDVPLFSTHPLIEQMGYIINENLRVANTDSVFEALADAVVINNGQVLRAAQVPGGKHVTVKEALEKIGEHIGLSMQKSNRTGRIRVAPEASEQLRNRIAQTWFAAGTDPNALRLSQMTVPREVVNRLIRIHDFYAVPEVAREVGGLFSKFTTLWKASVLAWPSRFVRDLYSNVFSLWLETGNTKETLKGLVAGSKVLNNDYSSLLGYFREIPRYSELNLTDEQLVEQVKFDVGRTGILGGLASADLLSANRRGDIGQYIPGSTPISVSRALGELKPQAGLTMGQRVSDFFTVKGVNNQFETRNPIFNASNMLGDTIDSMGRLGGFFALMRQGVAPEEAASRMMKSLVDYSSLTQFERNTMRNIAPWWAYWSRSGKYAVEQLLTRPGGRYGQTIRAINDLQATTDDQYIPTALRQRFAIRVPDFTGEGGSQTFLTDIDLPGIDVLNTLRLGYQPDILGSVLQSGQMTLGELANQANPLARTGVELLTGQDFYSKRPLDQAVTPLDTLYRGVTQDRYARINPLIRALANTGISVIPMGSRSVSALASVVDPRTPNVPYRVAKTLINNLTGVKLTNVDQELETLDALNKIRQQQAPYAREFVQSYIPAELLPRLPEQTQQLDALSRELNRDLREIYERKYGRKR